MVADAGQWPVDLAEAALLHIPDTPEGGMRAHATNPALFIVEYRDGFKGYVLMLTGYIKSFGYGARLTSGEVQATHFYLAVEQPHGHFTYLGLNAEEMFVTGKPSYVVERTLLTTGVLEAVIDSRYQGQVRLETPHLDVQYTSFDKVPWRPTAPRPLAPTLQPLYDESPSDKDWW